MYVQRYHQLKNEPLKNYSRILKVTGKYSRLQDVFQESRTKRVLTANSRTVLAAQGRLATLMRYHTGDVGSCTRVGSMNVGYFLRRIVNVCSCGFGWEFEMAFLRPVCVIEELQMLYQFVVWANFNFERRKQNSLTCVIFLQMTGIFFRKIFCKCDMLKERILKLQVVKIWIWYRALILLWHAMEKLRRKGPLNHVRKDQLPGGSKIPLHQT